MICEVHEVLSYCIQMAALYKHNILLLYTIIMHRPGPRGLAVEIFLGNIFPWGGGGGGGGAITVNSMI